MTLLRMRMRGDDKCLQCPVFRHDYLDEDEETRVEYTSAESPATELDFNQFFSPGEIERLKELKRIEAENIERWKQLSPEQMEREWHAIKQRHNLEADEDAVFLAGPFVCVNCGATEKECDKFFHDKDRGLLCEKCASIGSIGGLNDEN